ncbi:hypothetical protein HMPREF1545_00436 [Oscillibacter sp. KLE 1728]|nr:hypothetical protein HMPREF1545_00436 [Oscillibacter sp. KLE 1728]ERK66888.1 hypothetical protein HMPREF1546_00737 [Oscillibacter sp. KLE 1745]
MNRGGRQYDDHPDEICTIRHRTAVGESQKAMVCPKAAQIGACTDTPAPVSAESRCTGTVLKRFFSFTGPPWKRLRREQNPPGRRAAAPSDRRSPHRP